MKPVTYSNNIATPSYEQAAINEEERTILLSEIEKITHNCPPQHEESCSTCSFKTYQRLCVKALMDNQLSITDIADVVALIGVFVPSRRTERMASVFSDEALQSFIDAGEITPEEWDAVDFDDSLPMKALKNDIESIARGPLNVLKRSWGYQDLDRSRLSLVQRPAGSQKKRKSVFDDSATEQDDNNTQAGQNSQASTGYLSVADL
ncbi:hypothetical protein BGZ49_004803 [Haplosporangium sp. Z 27]|nr:hypothetical protein BGZ49_004803 [Haplosporangium sp. Z 27]